jgi:hypothetical protein
MMVFAGICKKPLVHDVSKDVRQGSRSFEPEDVSQLSVGHCLPVGRLAHEYLPSLEGSVLSRGIVAELPNHDRLPTFNAQIGTRHPTVVKRLKPDTLVAHERERQAVGRMSCSV